MEKSGSAFEQVELKYCERCGGLWLRRKGSERVYCVVCVPKMSDMPRPRMRGRARLAAPPPDLEVDSCVLELFGVVEGGQS
jgi:Zn-finger nucleic acid-binding protein